MWRARAKRGGVDGELPGFGPTVGGAGPAPDRRWCVAGDPGGRGQRRTDRWAWRGLGGEQLHQSSDHRIRRGRINYAQTLASSVRGVYFMSR